jgi:hypothetical protein
MPKTTASATIPAGEALSSSVDLSSGALAMVFAPSEWSGANVSFQISADGVAWADLFDASGAEVVRPLAAGTAVAVDPSLTTAALHVRIRSGPRAAPVAQEVEQVFTLVLI